MQTQLIEGIEFCQSPTYPTFYASKDGRVMGPTGRISLGSIDPRQGYRRVNWPLNGSYTKVAVHRIIMDAWIGPADGLHVDHINGITGDNRIENLRYVTIRENNHNRKRHRNGTVSGAPFLGITWVEKENKWHARIFRDGICKYLGTYIEKEDAAKAFDSALSMLGLPPVNFPL